MFKNLEREFYCVFPPFLASWHKSFQSTPDFFTKIRVLYTFNHSSTVSMNFKCLNPFLTFINHLLPAGFAQISKGVVGREREDYQSGCIFAQQVWEPPQIKRMAATPIGRQINNGAKWPHGTFGAATANCPLQSAHRL